MPKASVHKDDQASSGEDEIRPTTHVGKDRTIDPVAEPTPVEQSPELKLRFSVTLASAGHALTHGCGRSLKAPKAGAPIGG